ncbi:MAG: sigma-70 family RNA polymerase sigma factor [Planctomycetota bacterium]|nr:MAG: sigma-70 family RNA polymerase sigma factor [Planctomycetota bacterium]
MRSPPPPEDDRQKRLRLKSGDPEAFADLYREHQPSILNYVYRLSGGNSTLAEDVSQQVFMSFWTHRNEYDLDKPITPLLLTMARNAWLNAAKREDYRKTSELKEDGASARDRGLERRELETAIEKSLASLEEPLREVFILSRYHSLKYSQIAQMLGISIKTVEARLSRALQDLQKLLKDFL